MATQPKLYDHVKNARKKLHADVLRRYRKGEIPAAIARNVGLTPQRVGQIIKANAAKGEG